MIRFFALLMMAFALSPASAATFLIGVDDLPLMDGLVESSEEALSFDKPDGRIVRTSATGPVAPEEVRRFYVETLPQLGWISAPDNNGGGETEQVLIFERERERLRIATHAPRQAATQMIRVHFSIEPN